MVFTLVVDISHTVRNINITGNTFTKVGTDANFVKIFESDACSVTISGNTANEGMSIVVGPNETNLINVNITNNTFTNGGILLSEPTLSNTYAIDVNRLQSVTINLNTFAAGSQDTALVIDTIKPADVNWVGLLFTNNSILRSPMPPRKVNNITGGATATLLARHNYWGDATGPIGTGLCGTTGADVSTYVTFNPFWANSAMTTDANCPAP